MAIDNLRQRIIKVLFSYDWGVVEIQGALTKMIWGIWLLMPFPVFKTIEGYNSVGKENAWGWGLLILGTVHMIAINQKNLSLRKNITFIAFLFWVFTIVLIFNQSHTSGILPMFAVVAFFMGINYLRLRGIVKGLRKERRKVDLGSPIGVERRLKHE